MAAAAAAANPASTVAVTTIAASATVATTVRLKLAFCMTCAVCILVLAQGSSF